MNQILEIPNNPIDTIEISKKTRKSKYTLFFKIYFSLSIFIMLFSFIYYFNKMSNINKNERLSKLLIDNYNVSRLYSESDNTTSVNLDNGTSSYIIGIMQIDKINLKYPILSNINDYLLQIAPCKFYGPNFNEIR